MIYMKEGLKMNKCSIDKNYMNWLDVFTSKYCSFSDRDWIYGFNKLSESDMRNVLSLHLLYKQIENYSIRNHISNVDSGIGNFYKLKSDNSEFEIGILYGKGDSGKDNLYFCNKVEFDDNDNVVNFKDVINYKENHNSTNIELNKLSNNVLKLYKSGVPIDVIEYQLKNTINKCKTLKKKI